MRRAAFAVVAAFLAAASVARPGAPTVGGYICGSFNYDFNDPAGGYTAWRVYDSRHNSVRLNSAHLNLDGFAEGGADYHIGLDFGFDAALHGSRGLEQAITLSSGERLDIDPDADSCDVQEAYFTFPCPLTAGRFKIGKFATLEGIEVIESGANPTVTRGYLYGFAEFFTHVGLLYSLQAGNFRYAAGMVGGGDLLEDDNSARTLVAQMGAGLGSAGDLSIQAYAGAEGPRAGMHRDSVDLVAKFGLPGDSTGMLQGNLGRQRTAAGAWERWGGIGLQPAAKLNEWLVLGLRYEFFRVEPATGPGLNLQNVALAPAFEVVPGTRLRLEWRVDWANRPQFDDAAGELVYSASTLALEALTVF